MNRRSFVIACVAAPFSASAQTPDEWKTIVASDLKFRLEMPVPVQETKAPEKEKGQAGDRIAWESKRDGDMFDFDYVDYEAGWFSRQDSKQMARDLGRGEAEKAFPRATFKYIRDDAIALNGWDGYALDIEDTNASRVMMRTYIVKDRLYRMLVTTKGDLKSMNAATRVLESLRLAETQP